MMRRRATRWIAHLAALGMALGVAVAAPELSAQGLRPQKAQLRLAADRTAYEAGSTARLAAVVAIDSGWHTNSHRPTYDWLIPTELTLKPPAGWGEAEIAYPEGEMKTFAFAEEPISVYEGEVVLTARLTVPEAAAGVVPVTARLRYQACDDRSCLPPVETEATVELTVGPGGKAANAELFREGAPPARAAGVTSLATLLLLGMAGGLILNVMPCVLPVLSLKIFGLVQSAGHGRREVVTGTLATSAGILFSFWALAAAAVAARAAGAAVGWGTQFQHPGFVTFLAVVVVLFCLNLWGLFEVPLPQGLARVASAGPREGVAGHFGSGLFATLMATPCSAPFLGTALGFGLSLPAPSVFAIFTAIGVGMALPYLALAIAPGAARFLPKPGAWMETVKMVMGFLLAGAAVWLFYVLASQVSPERLAAIELGLLILALFVWTRSRAARPLGRRLAAAGIAAALVTTLWLGVRPGENAAGAATVGSSGLVAWVPFDRQQAAALASEGRLVFVDVTADWCLTCKVNERRVLETEAVAEAFDRLGVVPMKADWTNRDDEIGDFLADFGKAGIPFYVLYRPGREPHVFSELLTRRALLSALDESAGAAVAGLPSR